MVIDMPHRSLSAGSNLVKQSMLRLIEFNKRVMSVKKYNSYDEYLNSPFVAITRKGNKQFHEERLLMQHLFYIEDYRWFLINKPNIKNDHTLRLRINEKLVKTVQAYLDELESEKLKYLRPYRRTIKNDLIGAAKHIAKQDYNDFITRIVSS